MRALRALVGPLFVVAGALRFTRTRWYEVIMANVWMAQHPERYRVPGGRPALMARLPFQAVFVALVRTAMRRR